MSSSVTAVATECLMTHDRLSHSPHSERQESVETELYMVSLISTLVNIWNSLPNFVVDVDTVCLFKTRLDKFWMHHDVMYDFAADLTGIGDRSVREIS